MIKFRGVSTIAAICSIEGCRQWARPCVAAAVLLFASFAAHASHPDSVPVAGWLERARVSPGDIVLDAKLDSGAHTSSLHATNVQRFERDGKDWVAFDVDAGDGRSMRIARPLVRTARVKSALGADEARPTITLGICIGSVYRLTQVNLVDRGNLTKPLLIGRRFLKGRLVVDVSRRYVLEPACPHKTLR